jgi:hypothetical protein
MHYSYSEGKGHASMNLNVWEQSHADHATVAARFAWHRGLAQLEVGFISRVAWGMAASDSVCHNSPATALMKKRR